MLYSLKEILANTDSYFCCKKSDNIFDNQYQVSALLHDLHKGTVFIPLKVYVNGVLQDDYTDGKFEKALKQGVSGVFFDEKLYFEEKYRNILFNLIEKYKSTLDFVLIAKKDTMDMLSKLSCYTRENKISKKTKIIIITGSIGKTSTTEMLSSIMEQNNSVCKSSVGNIKFVIMHKFLELEKTDYDYMIFECSGASPGCLYECSNTVYPDGIIITRASSENLFFYKTIENIVKEKSTVMAGMNKDQIAVIDDTEFFHKYASLYKPKKIFVSDNDFEIIESDKNGSKFKYKDTIYEIPVVGVHQVSNAIKAIELALNFNIDKEDIKKGLKNFKQAIDRWVVDKYKGDIEFITDCPNNPSYETLIANIKTFVSLYKDCPNKRICIGRIKSLGDLEISYYEKIAKILIELPLNEIIVTDIEAKSIYEYIKNNSDIKTVFFERPDKLSQDAPLIKYIIETMNSPQAFLFKLNRDDYGIEFGQTKFVIRNALKDIYIKEEQDLTK